MTKDDLVIGENGEFGFVMKDFEGETTVLTSPGNWMVKPNSYWRPYSEGIGVELSAARFMELMEAAE
jgi:hypothetical protein